MTITQPKVAIITVTYNSESFIQNYLNSILSTVKQKQYQLVIVDNASEDKTCSIINKFIKHHHLENSAVLVKSQSNIGFGKGCNIGAEYAKTQQSSHLWFLNPDTEVYDNTGDVLLQYLIENNNAHFTGSILSDHKGNVRPGSFRFPGLLNIVLSELKIGFLDNLFQKNTTAEPIRTLPYRADWLTGASFMAVAESFYTLKGFDSYYFLYFEEVDLFFRGKECGFAAWTCPESNVLHMSGASTRINHHMEAGNKRPSYWFDSRQYFYRKNYGITYARLADLTLILCNLLWRIRSKLQNKTDHTPAHFLRDILKHGILGPLFSKK